MPLDWLNTPLDADIGELIAQRKRGKAIETLRRQLQGRLAPPVGVRLQLADLLMQAGRIEEAVPVLLGLATEFAADGFVAKAVAILKRVDRVQPGRADIAERLERLVHQQKRVSELPSRPRAAVPEFGIEEFAEGQELIVPTEELEPEGEEPLAELPESAPLELELEPEPDAGPSVEEIVAAAVDGAPIAAAPIETADPIPETPAPVAETPAVPETPLVPETPAPAAEPVPVPDSVESLVTMRPRQRSERSYLNRRHLHRR
jgi:hypothetical protein